MKKYYHMTSLNKIRSISNIGLVPSREDNNKLINSIENKVSFSEGMKGVVAKFANCQKHYDLIKSGVIGGIKPELVEEVQKTSSMSEYFADDVFIIFDGENVENEKNFMDGATDKSIDSENLNVCILKNNETGEVTYYGTKIAQYMMSKVPAETINYSGIDGAEKKIETIRQDVENYVKSHEKEIDTYKFGNYTLENIPVKSFCTQYLFSQGDSMSGQSIGKATMDLLKDIDAVREMEAQLDKAVRELVQGKDNVEQDHTIIPEERTERKTN